MSEDDSKQSVQPILVRGLRFSPHVWSEENLCAKEPAEACREIAEFQAMHNTPNDDAWPTENGGPRTN